jgi:hypothetical protein
MDDAPQAGIHELDVTRDGIDRQLSNEALTTGGSDNLLKTKGKTTAFPGPWGFDTRDSMSGQLILDSLAVK